MNNSLFHTYTLFFLFSLKQKMVLLFTMNASFITFSLSNNILTHTHTLSLYLPLRPLAIYQSIPKNIVCNTSFITFPFFNNILSLFLSILHPSHTIMMSLQRTIIFSFTNEHNLSLSLSQLVSQSVWCTGYSM